MQKRQTKNRHQKKEIEELKQSPFYQMRQLATRTLNKHKNMPTGLLSHYIALKYKTKIEVEGQGRYEIQVTSVVNARTLKEKPNMIPSLLSVAT